MTAAKPHRYLRDFCGAGIKWQQLFSNEATKPKDELFPLQPFFSQNSIVIFISPFTLEPNVLDKVSFTTHT
jgi:hypothetical protein